MAEYVDLDAVITAQLYDDEHEEWVNKEMTVRDYLYLGCDHIPLADVRPVVRGVGKWYRPSGMMPPEYTGKHRCSNCNSFAMRGWKSVREELTNYCPNCGANMWISEKEESDET